MSGDGVIQHHAVLREEAIELLQPSPGGLYVDGTVGGGGHASALMEAIDGNGRFIGIDKDDEAIERSKAKLAQWKTCSIIQGSFADMMTIVNENGATAGEVDGIMLDLGMSSYQLENSERGFSFMKDGPLDMRMDRSTGRPAHEIVNGAGKEELVEMLRSFGEERRAGRIAAAIIREREKEPILTTGRLAEIVEKALGGRRGGKHPATRTFQALRIEVNSELADLEKGLEDGIELLRGGGRMAVISFHSLEDRIVKRIFSAHAGKDVSLEAGGSEWRGQLPAVKLVNRKVITPTDAEIDENRRSRSAKLRVAEKC